MEHCSFIPRVSSHACCAPGSRLYVRNAQMGDTKKGGLFTCTWGKGLPFVSISKSQTPSTNGPCWSLESPLTSHCSLTTLRHTGLSHIPSPVLPQGLCTSLLPVKFFQILSRLPSTLHSDLNSNGSGCSAVGFSASRSQLKCSLILREKSRTPHLKPRSCP